MFTSIWEDIKQQFSNGNTLTRIILVNVAVFVAIVLVKLFSRISGGGDLIFYNNFIEFFSISKDVWFNLTHPWVLITHTFLHADFFHILWNMLLLYWFGRIVGDLLGDHRVLPIYLLCGLVGGLAFFAMAQVFTGSAIFGIGDFALGASAAFMGIITVAGVMAPDYIISLLFLGDIRLKYIVAVFMLLDLIAISGNSNTGGSFGHLGGALMGYIIARQLQKGNDLTAPTNNLLKKTSSFFNELFSKEQPRPKTTHRNPKARTKQRTTATRQKRSAHKEGNHSSDSKENLSHQERVDAILDKIKQSGYESLSKEEKEFLFNASKK